jgi:hypothetical protein
MRGSQEITCCNWKVSKIKENNLKNQMIRLSPTVRATCLHLWELLLGDWSRAGREILRYITWQTEEYKPGREILREYSEDPCTRGLPKYYTIYIVCGKHNQVNYVYCLW